MRQTIRGLTGLLRPASSLTPKGFSHFSSAANLMPIVNMDEFNMSDDYLSKTMIGSEEVDFASEVAAVVNG